MARRSQQPKRLLLVEDQETVRKVLRAILEEEDYEVLDAEHPREALALWAKHGSTLDLVVTDFVLPEMDGPELVERIRNLRPGIPVVYISGYLSEDVSERRFFQPGAAFLQKPFRAEALVRTVRELLSAQAPDSRKFGGTSR